MQWQTWLEAVGAAIGIENVQITGTLCAALTTVILLFIIVLATGGEHADVAISIGGLLLTIIFLVIEWYPVGTGAVMAFVMALYAAKVISSGG
ncbi:MAG TPA: hypothetical protein VMV49_11165 [Candidatus Deferrimicrobium sp.]|nr:hypothetical protein [Candidatus Deferrimicrobium sp.]